MNNNVDLKKYQDVVEVLKCDLFIDKNGNIYKVKPFGKNESNHNIWAEDYLEEIGQNSNNHFSLSPAEVLIHKHGFVYYSHDALMYKPIIKIPNPIYFREKVTEEQLNILFNVMFLNGENPFNVPMLNGEENIYDYVGLDNNKKKVKKLCF